MKKLALLITLILIIGGCSQKESDTTSKPVSERSDLKNRSTKWVKMNSSTYLLEAINASHIYLVGSIDSNTQKVSVSVLKATNEICKENGTSSDLGITTYTVSDRLIRFQGICINGNQVEVPNNEEGKKYLVDITETGEIFSIEMESVKQITFDPIGFGLVSSKLENLKNAL